MLRSLREQPEIKAEIDLQAEIDSSLSRVFDVPAPTAESVEAMLAGSRQCEPAVTPVAEVAAPRTARRQMVLIGLAALAAWIIVAWQFSRRRPKTPFFKPRPLAMIYRETIAAGFEPYYECREEDRFAATFAQRQGQPLRLAEMPAGSRMLGLSYTGGLSRDTTAMLCSVDEQPVMVFVDRLAADQPEMGQSDENVRVFRSERDGLVFYEVTPFGQPRVVEFLLPMKSEPRLK